MKQGLLFGICFLLLQAALPDQAVYASFSAYEAGFEIMPSAGGQWNDVQVELKITYGENDAKRHRGMKSIAVKTLQAVEVKDGGGKPLPFKVSAGNKENTIIWDLPEGERAGQTVIIRFYLPDAMTVKDGKNFFHAYWTGGGWGRQVAKAVYRFVFPPGFAYQDCSVYPKYGYTEGDGEGRKQVAVSMEPLKGESFALAFSPSLVTWKGGKSNTTPAGLPVEISSPLGKQEPSEENSSPDVTKEERESGLREAEDKQASAEKNLEDAEETGADLPVEEASPVTAASPGDETALHSRLDGTTGSDSEAELVYDSARELMEQEQYREAIATFRYFTKIYSQHPRSDEAHYRIGECYYNLADREILSSYQPAVDAFQLALALYPASAQAPRGFLHLAHSFRLMGYFYEAAENYQLLMDKHPQAECREEADFWMAECLFQNEDYVKAREQFSLFITRYPNSDQLRRATFRLADCLVGQKEFAGARELYARAWNRWPDYYGLFAETLYSMGQCSLKHNDYARARSQFFMAFNLFPGKPYNHIMLARIGDAYRLEGKLEEALKVYSQNRGIFPDTRGALISEMRMADIGVAHPGFFNYEEYLEPLKVYSRIIEENPASDLAEKALYRQGNLLSEQKRYEEAVASLTTVLTDYPESELSKKCALSLQENLIKLIDTHFQNRNYHAIIEIYDRYRTPFLADISNSRILFELGESFRHMGLGEQALELYERARRIYPPGHPEDEMMLSMGELYLERKEYQKAEDLFNKVITRFPKSASCTYAFHHLGDAYFEQGNCDEAEKAYLSAVKDGGGMKERDFKSLYCLGQCYERRNGAAAIETYRRAVMTDEQPGTDQADGGYVLRSFLALADCLYRAQRYRDAVEVYTRAVKRFPRDARSQWALYRIAEGYQKAGVEKSDIELLKQLQASAPGDTFWTKVIGGRVSSLEREAAGRETGPPLNAGGKSG